MSKLRSEADVERAEVLLKATYDILRACNNGPYVEDVFQMTAIWDEAECDGGCLMEEIADLLGVDSNE